MQFMHVSVVRRRVKTSLGKMIFAHDAYVCCHTYVVTRMLSHRSLYDGIREIVTSFLNVYNVSCSRAVAVSSRLERTV